MKTTVEALKGVYLNLGGKLTDTYDSIADGIAVGQYSKTPDIIEACQQVISAPTPEVKIVTPSADDYFEIVSKAVTARITITPSELAQYVRNYGSVRIAYISEDNDIVTIIEVMSYRYVGYEGTYYFGGFSILKDTPPNASFQAVGLTASPLENSEYITFSGLLK